MTEMENTTVLPYFDRYELSLAFVFTHNAQIQQQHKKNVLAVWNALLRFCWWRWCRFCIVSVQIKWMEHISLPNIRISQPHTHIDGLLLLCRSDHTRTYVRKKARGNISKCLHVCLGPQCCCCSQREQHRVTKGRNAKRPLCSQKIGCDSILCVRFSIFL